MARKAFVLGPGFVGREVIDRLLGDGYQVTTIVRRESAGEELTKAGMIACNLYQGLTDELVWRSRHSYRKG